MSSPLSWFRKHQKAMMIVFGVLLMVSFLIVPVLLDSMGNSGGGYNEDDERNETAVTWNGGSLTGYELQDMMVAQNQMVNFLDALERAAKSGDPDATSRATFPIQHVTSEAAMTRTLLMAQRAQEIGLVVSDEALYRHLSLTCDEMIPFDQGGPSEFRVEFASFIENRMSFPAMMNSLRTELLAAEFRQLSRSGLANVTPAQAFNHHNRLHRTVKIDTYPVKVDDFLAKVEDEPTDKELRALLDDGKKRFPNSDNSQPGFRQPGRIGIQYLKAELATFIDAAMKDITDEQIQAEREEAAKRKEEAKKKADEDLKGVEDAANKANEDSETEDGDDSKKESSESTDTKKGDEEEKTTPEREKDEDDSAESEDDSATPEDGSEASEDADDSDSKDDSEEKDDPDSESEESEETDDDIRRRLAHKPATEKMKAAIEAAQAELEDEDLEMTMLYIEWEIDQPKEMPRFDFIQMVKQAKKVEFDFDKFAAKHGLVFEEIEPRTGEELREHEIADAEEYDSDSGSTKRFMEMVFSEAKPFTPQSIISIPDDYLFWKTEVIENYVPDLGSGSLTEQAAQFDADMVLKDLGSRFENRLGKGEKWLEAPDGSQYFVAPTKSGKDCEVYKWDGKEKKTQSELVATLPSLYYDDPNLIEVLISVVKAWRISQATKLASKAADEYADQARKAKDKSLREVLEVLGKEVPEEPSEFKWLTQGSGGGGFGAMPMMSNVPNVENPSADFMKLAYSLRKGEIGVAVNGTNDVYYVIQCVDDGFAGDLQDRFVSSKAMFGQIPRQQLMQWFPPYGIPPSEFPSQMEVEILQREWLEELESDMKLVWKRDPQGLR